jgi:hypothetical protein|tara:strand:- start:549 stop:863 length:315 start_codon:yes stop_codon:yes gene_type:complete
MSVFLNIYFIVLLIIRSQSFDLFPIQTKIKIIELSAHILPKIDTIGHNLLLKNDILIKNVMEVEKIPIDTRKQIVLSIIRFTEYGDNFGGLILSNYHDIVDKLL